MSKIISEREKRLGKVRGKRKYHYVLRVVSTNQSESIKTNYNLKRKRKKKIRSS